MNPDMSDELYNDMMKGVVDKCYWDQYDELFPDIEPPVESLDDLDVGDIILDSDMFIATVLEAYRYEAEQVGGSGYRPPSLIDMSEYIREQYMDEIQYMEEEGLLDEGTGVTFMMDESAVLSQDIEPRISEVLDVLGLTYLQREFVKYFSPKTGTLQSKLVNNRVMNTSTINLFDFDFKNILVDRSSKEYEQSIQEGYNNLLRICLDYL